jgi:hypothetical protein
MLECPVFNPFGFVGCELEARFTEIGAQASARPQYHGYSI